MTQATTSRQDAKQAQVDLPGLYITRTSREAGQMIAPKLVESHVLKIYPATETIVESTRHAKADAQAWLREDKESSNDGKT